MQHMLYAVELQRVSGIGTTLKACYHVVLRRQHVDHFSFSLVAPLEA